MSIASSNILCVPQDVQTVILSYLDYKSLGSYSRVCKAFGPMTDVDSLWKKLFSTISFPAGISAKEYLNRHAVSSIDTLLAHFRNFANNVQLNTKNQFIILCPLNLKENCGGFVELYVGTRDLDPKTPPKMTYVIFLKKMDGEFIEKSANSDSSATIYRNNAFVVSEHFELLLPTKDLLQMRPTVHSIVNERIGQLRKKWEQPLVSTDLPLLCRIVKYIFDSIFG
jgi:F-box associated protein